MPKICLAITSNHEKVDRDFMIHLVSLQRPGDAMVSLRGEHIKSASLNEHVKAASDAGCSHIFFMDVDMNFPPTTLTQLMSHNLPIVSGLYHLKATPYSPIAGWTSKDGVAINGNGKIWKEDYCPLPRDSLVEVHWCGIGCLLVDMDVFNKIWYPPFWDVWDKEHGMRHKGHDVIFCEEARKAGYKVYVDTTTDVTHIGRSFVNRAWVETYHRVNMDGALLDTVHEYSLEQPWWDEKWAAVLASKRERGYPSLVKEFIAKVPKGVSVIDLGCGDGSVLRALRDYNECDVFGLDFSKSSMTILKEKGIPGEQADLRVYEPNGRRAHTVILSHVLEHMTDDSVADRLVKVVSTMAEEQAFIVVPDDKDLWYEHCIMYDEAKLRAAVAPHFPFVEMHCIERNSDAPSASKHHIVAHCRKHKPAESDEVNAGITGANEGGVPSAGA